MKSDGLSSNNDGKSEDDNTTVASSTAADNDEYLYFKIQLQYHIQWKRGMMWNQVLDVLRHEGWKTEVLDHRIATDTPSKEMCMEEFHIKILMPQTQCMDYTTKAQAITLLRMILSNAIHQEDGTILVKEWDPTKHPPPKTNNIDDGGVGNIGVASPGSRLRRRLRRLKTKSTPIGSGSGLFDDAVPISTSTTSATWGIPAKIEVDGEIFHIRMARDSLQQLKEQQQGGSAAAAGGSHDYHGLPLIRNGRRVLEIIATYDSDHEDEKDDNDVYTGRHNDRLYGFVRK